MKLHVIHQRDVGEEPINFQHALSVNEDHALKLYRTKHREYQGRWTHIERRPLSFSVGTSHLYAVMDQVYNDKNYSYKCNNIYWMCDDFYEYVDTVTGQALFYCHWAHGDCSHTWYEIE